MANKIFVSYKHNDTLVQQLHNKLATTVRDYVDEIEVLLDENDHIYKGEHDGEDLGSLADSTIGSKLGDKIFDSSVTIVLVSLGMKETWLPEKEQWIPWEISYSLKEQSRLSGRSKTNAVLAVILPDTAGSYSYFITYNKNCNSRTLNTNWLFRILGDNMFNHKKKEDEIRTCNGSTIYTGDPSYIQSVEWEKFVSNPQGYIEKALELRGRIAEYEIVKNLK